jgi:hypothetical protein
MPPKTGVAAAGIQKYRSVWLSVRVVASLDRKSLGAKMLAEAVALIAERFSMRRQEGSRWAAGAALNRDCCGYGE